MERFIYNVPTRIAFGRGQIEMLPKFIREYGTKVLLVYGGGSIKRTGIYDDAIGLMKKAKITYMELSGVEPNPQIATVRKGVEICKKKELRCSFRLEAAVQLIVQRLSRLEHFMMEMHGIL